jgi:CheY-like chemotaxis protein
VVHEEPQQNDDWDWNPDQPKQQPSSETHGTLLVDCCGKQNFPGNALVPRGHLKRKSRRLNLSDSEASDSKAIARILPFLRRYARALAGSQTAGDAYVAATLEALIADKSLLQRASNPRMALYRVFTKLWNSVSVNQGADFPDPGLPPEQRLAKITPLPRQAFLLMSLEEFSEQEAAEIIQCDIATLRGLIDQSAREMASEIATDVLIIEDETLIAMELQALVESMGHRVVGVASTHARALSMAEKHKPGLILSDIQLADGSSGMDAVNDLLRSFEVPVIFITAYPERFLTGERPEPAFLIAKPFQPAKVAAIASQALFFEQKARLPERSS